jgi:nucleoside-diphosphate-sugar epimerase
MVYGPRDPQQRVQSVVRRLRENPDRLGLHSGEAAWRCTRGYVEDVAFGIALPATHPRSTGQIFNLGERDALTEQEWIGAIGRAIGWAGAVEADPGVAPSLPARWEVPLMVSTETIRRQLGYDEPVGREEGIRRAVKR